MGAPQVPSAFKRRWLGVLFCMGLYGLTGKGDGITARKKAGRSLFY